MDAHQEKVYQRLVEFYGQGGVPWDDELPPPEVMAEIDGRPSGRALDLGCGYGRASIYMARAGWEVDGVDFVAQAAATAAERARAAGVEVRFHIASVTDLGFLAGPYDFALDVGCVHALNEEGVAAYHRHLKRLVGVDGRYLLYVRLRDESEPVPEEGPKGIPERLVRTVFSDGFALEKVEKGITEVPEMAPWASAWFYFRRVI